MHPSAAALTVLASAAMLFAGCASTVTPTALHAPGALAAEMLAHPPGQDVAPTGDTVHITLYLHRMTHEIYPGANMSMWGFSLSDDPATATVPGPTIRVHEGDHVSVTFLSTVPGFDHTLHWHGVHVPWRADGVPFLTQDPIPAGQEGGYDFVAEPSGTFWYHCHVDTAHHLDMGMYGALVIEPRDAAQDPPYDREAILMLDEMDRFHLESGQPAVGNQPQSGDAFDFLGYGQREAQDLIGRNQVVQDHVTGSPLRPARDWYPVTYPPYHADLNTFLINGHAFPHTDPLFIGDGETMRIRLIDAGDQVHAMHLHGHHMLVTHKDGVLLASPYWADTVLIGPGERYDVYVRGVNPGIWDFHDHINSNVQNDHIAPGGMMTVLVYESFRDQIPAAHHGAHGRPMAGDYVGLQGS